MGEQPRPTFAWSDLISRPKFASRRNRSPATNFGSELTMLDIGSTFTPPFEEGRNLSSSQTVDKSQNRVENLTASPRQPVRDAGGDRGRTPVRTPFTSLEPPPNSPPSSPPATPSADAGRELPAVEFAPLSPPAPGR